MAKKLKTELLTLCDHALTSQQGKLSLIGLFDRIFAKQLPLKYPRFFIVAILEGEPGSKHTVTLQIKAPSEKEVLPERSVTLQFGGNGRANILTDLANLQLDEAGEYSVLIQEDDKQVGKKTFFVSKIEDQQVNQGKN